MTYLVNFFGGRVGVGFQNNTFHFASDFNNTLRGWF